MKTKKYEYVNKPTHYNTYSKETIQMMVDIFGIKNTIIFCEINAFKYRMRLGMKPNEPFERDFEKEQWYLKKAEELKNNLNKSEKR